MGRPNSGPALNLNSWLSEELEVVVALVPGVVDCAFEVNATPTNRAVTSPILRVVFIAFVLLFTDISALLFRYEYCSYNRTEQKLKGSEEIAIFLPAVEEGDVAEVVAIESFQHRL